MPVSTLRVQLNQNGVNGKLQSRCCPSFRQGLGSSDQTLAHGLPDINVIMTASTRWRLGISALVVTAALATLSNQGSIGAEVGTKSTPNSVQWPTYNNGYKGQRFSPLIEITAKNVDSLKEVCRLKLAEGGSLQAGPVVVGRAMYLTTLIETFSINPTNCKVLWKSSYEPEQMQVWPASNRGVAVMNGRVFRGTGDGRLLALDAETGEVIWKNVVGDPTLNEFVPGAPLAWNGLVFTGTAGADFGIKGRILAYDALSGREVWRFVTIPTGDEVGADTWHDRHFAKIGGGGTWSSFALDVISGEVFIPVANPTPVFTPELRPGANLFTNSVVVLDALTGDLKWWYQLNSNDGHDLDLAAAPMLYTNSEDSDVVAAAGKNGYVYVVDRLTHRLLFKTTVTTIENEGVRPSEKETKFCPGGAGGTLWNGPALDPTTRTLFVGAVDWCTMVKATGETHFIRGEGRLLWGATVSQVMEPPPSGWLSALNSDTGEIKWKHQAAAPIIGGVTVTAGGIVMTGDTAGNFLALDSATGQVLYKKDTGGAIAGGVITYAIDDTQYVAFTSGNVSRTVFGTVGKPNIVIMALPRKAQGHDPADISSGAAGSTAPGLEGTYDIERGRSLYLQNCSACHGPNGEGGAAPGLTSLKERQTFETTVQWLKNPTPVMPRLFPSPLGEQDVRDIVAFIRNF